jgi:hypothetical protein
VSEEESFYAKCPNFFNRLVLTTAVVNRFLSFVFSATFTDAVQGRIRALNDVPLGAAHLLVSSTDTHMTDQFKTSGTYGFQAVIIPEWLKKYVRMWISTVRPAILLMLTREQATKLSLLEAPLWIRMNGSKVVGHQLISNFFRDKLGLNVTRYRDEIM